MYRVSLKLIYSFRLESSSGVLVDLVSCRDIPMFSRSSVDSPRIKSIEDILNTISSLTSYLTKLKYFEEIYITYPHPRI